MPARVGPWQAARMTSPLPFAGAPLDRAAARRKDEAWVAEQRAHPDAELIVLWRGQVLHERGQGASRLLPLTLAALTEAGGEPVLLGLRGETPVWTVDAGHRGEPPLRDLGAYASLRDLAPYLPPDELALAGHAVWLTGWHHRHPFDPRTGEPSEPREGGAKRVAGSGAEQFPRVDVVAIVLPTLDDRVCLGRSPHFPPGFLSAFAGFMEPGESLEECAARELHEETGLVATSLTYRASQPWPFPSSLMVGFEATVVDDALVLDPAEIDEARWLTRDEARAALAGEGPVMVPPPVAIAHHLLKGWVER